MNFSKFLFDLQLKILYAIFQIPQLLTTNAINQRIYDVQSNCNEQNSRANIINCGVASATQY